MLIKRKDKLTEVFKKYWHTVGDLDWIAFSDDGDWALYKSDYRTENPYSICIPVILDRIYKLRRIYKISEDKAITEEFLDIEDAASTWFSERANMKSIKLKNKTKLRKIIKKSKKTADKMDWIVVKEDGSWAWAGSDDPEMRLYFRRISELTTIMRWYQDMSSASEDKAISILIDNLQNELLTRFRKNKG